MIVYWVVSLPLTFLTSFSSWMRSMGETKLTMSMGGLCIDFQMRFGGMKKDLSGPATTRTHGFTPSLSRWVVTSNHGLARTSLHRKQNSRAMVMAHYARRRKAFRYEISGAHLIPWKKYRRSMGELRCYVKSPSFRVALEFTARNG